MKKFISALIVSSLLFGSICSEMFQNFKALSAFADWYGGTAKIYENGLEYKTFPDKVIITGIDEKIMETVESIEIPAEIEKLPVKKIDGKFCVYPHTSNLKEIIFPGSLEYINISAVIYTPWLDNQPDGVLYADTMAFGYKDMYRMPPNTVIELKEGTAKILNEAFYNGREIAEIKIPDTVESIGEYAFYFCSNLNKVTIPSSVKYIGKNAFADCRNLSDINICGGIESVESWTFYNCGLEKIELPDSVKSIKASAFSDCENLTQVTIPDSVSSIEEFVFFNCKNLKKVFIPQNADIGKFAFGYYKDEIKDEEGSYYVYKKSDDFKIYGVKDSAAEEYAIENGFEFIEWDGKPIDKIPSAEIEPTLKGDANGDGLIDVRDVAAISKYLIKMIDFTEQEFANADVMKDNLVNINDLTHLKRFLIHDISKL